MLTFYVFLICLIAKAYELRPEVGEWYIYNFYDVNWWLSLNCLKKKINKSNSEKWTLKGNRIRYCSIAKKYLMIVRHFKVPLFYITVFRGMSEVNWEIVAWLWFYMAFRNVASNNKKNSNNARTQTKSPSGLRPSMLTLYKSYHLFY